MTRLENPPNGIRLAALMMGLIALACASTPTSRIEDEQTLFDTYPTDVQEKIRAGQVDLGFDPQMVRMAMGDPDETSTETTEDGETLMWGYTRSRPGVSVGIGGGSFGGGGGLGGGVGMGSGSSRDYVAIIEFRDGRVTKVRDFDR
jgi:hypothetical protein